jgi:hypothetical protein
MGYRANVVPMFFCFVFFGEKKWSELFEMDLIKILLGGIPPPPFLKLFLSGLTLSGGQHFWRVKFVWGG